jgi:hypothetical protein
MEARVPAMSGRLAGSSAARTVAASLARTVLLIGVYVAAAKAAFALAFVHTSIARSSHRAASL